MGALGARPRGRLPRASLTEAPGTGVAPAFEHSGVPPRRGDRSGSQRLGEVGADDDPAPQPSVSPGGSGPYRVRRPQSCSGSSNTCSSSRRRPPVEAPSPCDSTIGVRDEDDGEARCADAQRQVDVLDVEKEPLVEQACALDRRAGDRHRGTVRTVDVVQIVEAVRPAEPGRASPK